LEVKKTAAVANVVIPALTKPQMYNATLKAIFLFDEKFLQLRKQNEGVIVVSIAVSAEGLHPSGSNLGLSIVKELERTSLYSGVSGMANLVRLVTRKGVSYYENPTVEEQKRFGASGELLFNAEGNKELAMHVEKVMQVYVLNRKMIVQENIKLLQLTAGTGSLRQGSPYKVGLRFFLLETIEKMGFVFKDTLSNKQLLFPMLPKVNDNNDNKDSKPAAVKVAKFSLNGKSDSDDKSELSCEQSSSIGY